MDRLLIVGLVLPDGRKYLLEVNHIPNVTVFPDLREAYLEFAENWARTQTAVTQA